MLCTLCFNCLNQKIRGEWFSKPVNKLAKFNQCYLYIHTYLIKTKDCGEQVPWLSSRPSVLFSNHYETSKNFFPLSIGYWKTLFQ